MKVIRHNKSEDYTNYTIRKANGDQFTASYSKRLGTFACPVPNGEAVIDAVCMVVFAHTRHHLCHRHVHRSSVMNVRAGDYVDLGDRAGFQKVERVTGNYIRLELGGEFHKNDVVEVRSAEEIEHGQRS